MRMNVRTAPTVYDFASDATALCSTDGLIRTVSIPPEYIVPAAVTTSFASSAVLTRPSLSMISLAVQDGTAVSSSCKCNLDEHVLCRQRRGASPVSFARARMECAQAPSKFYVIEEPTAGSSLQGTKLGCEPLLCIRIDTVTHSGARRTGWERVAQPATRLRSLRCNLGQLLCHGDVRIVYGRTLDTVRQLENDGARLTGTSDQLLLHSRRKGTLPTS